MYNDIQTLMLYGFGLTGVPPTEVPTWVLEHGYIIMFLIMLIEGPIITATSAFGAALGYFNIYLVFAISFLANFLPDFMFYLIGVRGGQTILDRFGHRVGIMPDKRRAFAEFIGHNLGMWLFLAKAMPFLGPPGIVLMGTLRIPVKQFVWWDALIVGLTSLFFCLIGYYSGKGYEALLRYTEYGVYALVVVFLLFILITYLFRKAAKKLSQKIEGLAVGEESMANLGDADTHQGTGDPKPHLRVLLANDTYPPQLNGAAVTTRRLALGLARRGHQVAVIGPGTRFKDEVEHDSPNGVDAVNGGVMVYRLRSIPVRPIHPYFRMLYILGVTEKVERIVQDFQPDVIHVQNHFILGKACLRVARRYNIPIIGTNHFMPQNIFELIPGPLQPPLSDIMWKGFLKVYNQLDCITVPSLAAQKMVQELGLKGRTQIISNGIDLERYRKAAPPADVFESVFHKYGISRDRPTFITVGRLEKDKNVDLVLKATELVARERPIQTIIVGKGRDEAEFRELAEKLGLEGTAIFTGPIDDDELFSLYGLADIYIGAGSAELQGLAVMEAMAMGLPVLALNAVALPELVRDGENGLLFSLDHTDLAEKMLKVLSQKDAWNSMSEKSLAYIQAHDMRKVLAQFEDLYYEAITSAHDTARRSGSVKAAT